MTISLDDIDALIRQNDAELRKLKERGSALLVLREMFDGSKTEQGQRNGLDLSGIVPIDSPRKTLKASVEEVVGEFGDSEFTVAGIERLLQLRGEMPNSKSPRASIAMALNKLEEVGLVERTYRGTGSEPHRFRAVSIEEFYGVENEAD